MIERSGFTPVWWLRGPHRQTLWGALARHAPRVPLRWEVVDLPDGDFVELAWVDRPLPPDAPTAIVLHGLTGSVRSRNVRGLLDALDRAGWRAACFHFRGCGRGPNRTSTGYHSGLTDDPRHVLSVLRARHPGPLAAVGLSLGANVLLKLLGEDGPDAPLDAAVAISPPLVLDRCADRLERGAGRVYQASFLRKLVAYVREKEHLPGGLPVDRRALARVRTFREFDDLVTAPLHGFRDAADYYDRASSRPFLPRITVPTLVIHAEDDPFFEPEVVPAPHEVPDAVRFELAPRGGHVGFVEGRRVRPRYYLDRRVPEFLAPFSRR